MNDMLEDIQTGRFVSRVHGRERRRPPYFKASRRMNDSHQIERSAKSSAA